MACKNSLPPKRCGGCKYLDRESYRGAGLTVCYELNCIDGKKAATTVSAVAKACNSFSPLKVAN